MDWGVDYSPSFICREVLQNARDGAISQGFSISDIKTSLKSGQIIVQGPSDYNLKLLFYIGGTKANDETQLGKKFGPLIYNFFKISNSEGSLISVVSLIKLGIEYPIFISGKLLYKFRLQLEVTVMKHNLENLVKAVLSQ